MTFLHFFHTLSTDSRNARKNKKEMKNKIDFDYWPHLKWKRFENYLKTLPAIFRRQNDSQNKSPKKKLSRNRCVKVQKTLMDAALATRASEIDRNENRKRRIIPVPTEVVWLNSITCRSLDSSLSRSHTFLSRFSYWAIDAFCHSTGNFLSVVFGWHLFSVRFYYYIYYIFIAFILYFKIIFPIRHEWVSVAIVQNAPRYYCSQLTAIYSDRKKTGDLFDWKLILRIFTQQITVEKHNNSNNGRRKLKWLKIFFHSTTYMTLTLK